jgi:hypothetical protein
LISGEEISGNEIGIKDRFLEFTRDYFKDTTILRMVMDGGDRIFVPIDLVDIE